MRWWDEHPALAYSLARLVLFAVPFLLLILVIDPIWALLVAFVVSAIASIFVLAPLRDSFATSLATRKQRAQERMAERAAVEDAWDERQRETGRSDHKESGGDSH